MPRGAPPTSSPGGCSDGHSIPHINGFGPAPAQSRREPAKWSVGDSFDFQNP
jgi:hypothetical protein